MNAEAFIDTNVFLYTLSDRPEEQQKAERARELLLNENWGWSVQVAGEFYPHSHLCQASVSIAAFFCDGIRKNLDEFSHRFASSLDSS